MARERKIWQPEDIVHPEDAQYWEDKPDRLEVEEIVKETSGSSEVVEEVKSDLDEHLKDKGNPHEVTAEQVGSYTKEETDGRIGNLDDLETESKENLVSAINELKNETAEIADTSVKTISVGKGLDRIVHYPDENGDINFADDFYIPNRGKVIAEGDMPTYKGLYVKNVSGIYARVETEPLSFVINDEDINSFAGIAVDYDLLWYSNPDNDWWGTEKIVIPINKLSSIPGKDFSSVYFKVTEATTLNTVLFSKEDILENVNSSEYISQTIYGQFLRRYEQGIAVDEKLKTHFESGSVNCAPGSAYDTANDQLSRDYKKNTISGIENDFYYYNDKGTNSKSWVSKGNTISMVMNLKDNILNIKPIPLVYYGYEYDGSGLQYWAKSTLTIMMVPTKIYYYD